jgi:hypothetical protein
MATAQRDSNNVPVLMGATPSGVPMPIPIDPVSGRVVASIYSVGSLTNTLVSDIERDDNNRPVLAGAKSPSLTVPIPILIDKATGGIPVTITTG